MRRHTDALKIKAKFKVEFEVEDDAANSRYTLKRARAERRLKEIIEEGRPGRPASTGIKRNSTAIK